MTQLPKTESLVLGDKPEVAIVSLWTPVTFLTKRLDKSQYGMIGNLYSAERGIDSLLRSLFTHPEIKHLIITGADTAKSGQVLFDFFQNGFAKGKTKTGSSDAWVIKSEFEGYLDLDLPEDALQELRDSICVYRLKLTDDFAGLKLVEPVQTRKKQVFEKKTTFVKKYFGEPSTYVFRSARFSEAWLRSLDSLIKFSHHQDAHQTLFNAQFILSSFTPGELFVPDFISFKKEEIQSLVSTSLSDNDFATHLDLLLNQGEVAFVINLSENTKLEVSLQEISSKLYLHAVVKAKNALELPTALYGLHCLYERFWQALSSSKKNLSFGTLVLTVVRLSLQEHQMSQAKALVEKYYTEHVTPAHLLPDMRGNFVIYISQGEIVVEHLSATNELIYMYVGKTALSLRDQLMRENIVGTIAHGLYLGTELQKAEIALSRGLKYIQDKPVDFSDTV